MVDGAAFRERVSLVAGGRVAVDPDEFELISDAIAAGDDWYVAALVRHEGRVAFVRNRWSDGWVLPGGGIEAGETAAAAVEREIGEETGLSVERLRPLASVEQRFEPAAGDASAEGAGAEDAGAGGGDGERVATKRGGADGTSATGHMAVFEATVTSGTLGDDLGEDPEEIEDAAWFDGIPDRIDGTSRDLLAALVAESGLGRES